MKTVEGSCWKAGILSLATAWIVTMTGLMAWWWLDSGRLGPGEPLSLEADDLLVEGAQGRRVNDRLDVLELQVDERRPEYLRSMRSAVAWTGSRYLETYPYRYAVCRCSWRGSRTSLRFMWQAGRFAESRSVPFASRLGGVLAEPATDSDWTGTIFALGLLLQGDDDSRFSIRSLDLYPDSAWMRLRSTWAHWLAFKRWDMKSINTIGKDSGSAPSLVVVCLVAFTLSAAFFLVVTRWRAATGRMAGVALLAAFTWLLLDVRWFLHLSQQVGLTSKEYMGLAVDERVAREDYAPIVAISERIRDSVASDRSVVFMITDNPEARYLQERLAFHLYPLNVFNFRRRFWVLRKHVRPDDYLIVLESPGPVSYDAQAAELRWDNKGGLCAEHVFSHVFASLYKICTPET